MLARLLPILLFLLLAACTTPQRLTAKATDCATRDVSIVPSLYSRKGMETAWCASCKDRLYRCVTNIERTRTTCVESHEGDGCQ